MSFESDISPDWLSASGMRLEGNYELTEFVSAEGRSAFFRTPLPGDGAARGLVKLIQLDPTDATRQRDLWDALASVSHQNLLRIVSAGVTEIDGKSVAFLISDNVDESLASVIKERSLTAAEIGELLLSLQGGLQQLHEAGFVHGRICPAEIFAVGEAVKLSVDGATRAGEKAILNRGSPPYLAPEQDAANITAAADIWCAGATLFEALTQTPYSAERLEEARSLPEPFSRIIPRCVDPTPEARPSLTDLRSLYAEAEEPQKVSEPLTATALPKTEEMQTFAREAQTTNTLGPPYLNEASLIAPEKKRRVPMLVPAIAVFVLLVALSLWWIQRTAHRKEKATEPNTSAAVTTQTIPAQAPGVTTSVPAAPAQTSTHEQVPAGNPTQDASTRTNQRSVWRVILWTFARRSDAQNRVDDLAANHPDLHPEVFAPKGDDGPFLVVAGGEMNRDEAEATRRKARQLGLPRDTYIQNFSH